MSAVCSPDAEDTVNQIREDLREWMYVFGDGKSAVPKLEEIRRKVDLLISAVSAEQAGRKDMNDPAVQQEYQEKVCDQARTLATECGKDTAEMERRLKALGAHPADIHRVYEAQVEPYANELEEQIAEDDDFDEGVYETVKDALRPLYGF